MTAARWLVLCVSIFATAMSERTFYAEERFYGDLSHPMIFVSASSGGNCSVCTWTSAIGTITAETPDAFEHAFVADHYAPQDIVINSLGGDLIAGIKLGRSFR